MEALVHKNSAQVPGSRSRMTRASPCSQPIQISPPSLEPGRIRRPDEGSKPPGCGDSSLRLGAGFTAVPSPRESTGSRDLPCERAGSAGRRPQEARTRTWSISSARAASKGRPGWAGCGSDALASPALTGPERPRSGPPVPPGRWSNSAARARPVAPAKRRCGAGLELVEDLAAAIVERGKRQGRRHAGQARTRGGGARVLS
jgi:hypothetical protein